MPSKLFSFTLSSNNVSIAPSGTVTVTITQTAAAGVTVNYRISSVFPGGFNDSLTLDLKQQIFSSIPYPRTITGNGTLVLTLKAAAGAVAQSISTYVYGYVFTSGAGDPAQNILPITITVS